MSGPCRARSSSSPTCSVKRLLFVRKGHGLVRAPTAVVSEPPAHHSTESGARARRLWPPSKPSLGKAGI
ncbi:hypothetical protein VTI74DRAFT_4963 [Chaetomium olivicolor]